MADISTDSGSNRKGGRKRKSGNRMSTKVDMTPMVDLAFLLITFFMLTTTFGKSQTMEVNMPDKTDKGDKMEIKESRTLTLILGEKDKIFWYSGFTNPQVHVTGYFKEGIRKVIAEKQAIISEDLVVIIKPGKDSKYKNLVDILDEIHLTGGKVRYSISKVTERDHKLLATI